MNNAIDETDLTDIYRTFHLSAAEYIFFSLIHEIFSSLDHYISLNRFRKIEIILGNFSGHTGKKIEVKNRRKAGKFTSTWNLKNTLMNKKWIKEKNQKGSKKSCGK